jgi:hypothetical protein
MMILHVIANVFANVRAPGVKERLLGVSIIGAILGFKNRKIGLGEIVQSRKARHARFVGFYF